MFRYISQNIFMLETLDHHINLQVVFFVEETMISGVFFDGIKDMVVPRFVGVIVEVISQLATLSKFNGRILNHNKCLDNGGLILVNQPTNIHFRRFGMGKVRCPPKKDATGPK